MYLRTMVSAGLLISLAWAGNLWAGRWEFTASQLFQSGQFELPAGDTLVVDKDMNRERIDWSWISWNESGRVELINLHLIEDVGRENGFPITVSEGQELALTSCRVEAIDEAILLEGGTLQSEASVLSAQGIVIHSTTAGSDLQLSDTRIGASGTALRLLEGEAELEDCVFLTNDLGLDVVSESQLVVRDCLFQGNDVGLEIRGDQVPALINVDIVDSRYWDLINHSESEAVNLNDVYLSTGNTSRVQGLFEATTMPQEPRHTPYEAGAPLLIPQDVVIGEVPLTIDPLGITSVDGIPCRESRYKVFFSENAYQFSAEPDLITTTPDFTLPIAQTRMRYVRVVAEIGKWDD